MTTITKLKAALAALDELARLGNGGVFGNSIGNTIAQRALPDLRSVIAEMEAGEPVGYVSQHTTKGPYEWQFNREFAHVYRDTAISVNAVYTHPQPKAEPSSSDKTWCQYIAGMIGAYLGEPVDSEKCNAIAGIIERRLWALPVQYPAQWATFLHYPEHWDTAAYPTLQSAIHEALAWSGCSVCKAEPVQEPVAGWQERQMFSDGSWSNWYPCSPRLPGSLLEKVLDQITYQWRPVYAAAPQAKPLAAEIMNGREIGIRVGSTLYPVPVVRAIEAAHGITDPHADFNCPLEDLPDGQNKT